MAQALLDTEGSSFSSGDAINYGCAGRGDFDSFSKTLGKQVDLADKAFYKWKKCVQCATVDKFLAPYKFDSISNSCGKLKLTFSRPT